MRKVQKVWSINIQSDCKTTSKKRADSSFVFTVSGKGGEKKGWRVNTKNDYETMSKKNGQIKFCVFYKSD